MKNATLVLLCCSAFLAACDSSNETSSKGEASQYDNASAMANDTTNAVNNASDEMGKDLNSTLESARADGMDTMDAANDAVDSGKESAAAAVDTAKESIGGAVDAGKEMATATAEKSASVIAAAGSVVDSANTNEGESVYKNSCNACHGTGVAGSPKIGDKAAWSTRIAQGNAVLIEHALKGYQGEKGYMPPKGGSMHLSDDQVSAAVLYMVSQAQ